MKTSPSLFSVLCNCRIFTVALLGFFSGLPLALTAGTLQAWLTVSGVDIVNIGILSLVAVPYVYKFLWSPFMDRFTPPYLGRRRGWMLITQLGLLGLLIFMALQDPGVSPWFVGGIALMVAFVSASQDISIDAYRTELLRPDELGFGMGMFVSTYRLANVLSSGGALILADHWGWRATYILMGLLMGVGALVSYFAPEPQGQAKPPVSLYLAIVRPFAEFLKRDKAIAILIFIILYKLGDAFSLSLTSAFLLNGVGFSLSEVGAITKILGMLATIVGALVAGVFMVRLGIFRALMYFGILQAISNLMFMWLAVAGKNILLLCMTIGLENLCAGMGTAAFLAFLVKLCDKHYTATQIALFSALAAVGRVSVGPLSGVIVEHMGWVHFYFFSFLAGLPGLFVLGFIAGVIEVETCAVDDVFQD